MAVGPQVDAKDKGIILNNENMLCSLILDYYKRNEKGLNNLCSSHHSPDSPPWRQ